MDSRPNGALGYCIALPLALLRSVSSLSLARRLRGDIFVVARARVPLHYFATTRRIAFTPRRDSRDRGRWKPRRGSFAGCERTAGNRSHRGAGERSEKTPCARARAKSSCSSLAKTNNDLRTFSRTSAARNAPPAISDASRSSRCTDTDGQSHRLRELFAPRAYYRAGELSAGRVWIRYV